MVMLRFFRLKGLWPMLLLAPLLVACGGGSSSSRTPPTDPSSPTTPNPDRYQLTLIVQGNGRIEGLEKIELSCKRR